MWDGLAGTHFKNYHIERLLGGTPLLNDVIRQEVGDVRGKSLVHLLCHIGTDTLSWALLGAQNDRGGYLAEILEIRPPARRADGHPG